MKKAIFIILPLLAIICLGAFTDDAIAKDYANFESFYKESSFWSWVIGIGAALLALAVVIFTGGTASPLVAGIGSAIGGMMGLSGAAATSAGLALLGGGSLAAGGFGMAGGVVLINAIIEGTILAGSQYVDSLQREATYQELCQQTKDYPNFLPIKNDSGPSEIGKVVKILDKDYDPEQPNSSERNQRAVREALYELNKYTPEQDAFYKINYKEVIRHEQLRVYSLRAMLYFMENDYKTAYSRAQSALRYYEGTNADGPASVPNFIIATAGLMTKEIAPDKSVEMFTRVVANESDCPILPLLFSIYISRAGSADAVSPGFLQSIIYSASRIDDKKIRPVVDSQIMMAILARLWKNQQDIVTIADNIQSFNLQKAKARCGESLKNYETLLGMAKSFLNRFPSETTDERKVVSDFSISIQKYNGSLAALQQVVAKVESIRESAPVQDTQPVAQPAASIGTDNGVIVSFVICGAFVVLLLVIGKIKKRKAAEKGNEE